LGGEPARGHNRVGIGASYEALGAAHPEKAGAGSIHPHLTGWPGSLAGTAQETEVQRWMHAADFAGAFCRPVSTAIQYQQDFVLVMCDPLLRRERLEAGCNEVFFVSGRHDDTGPESRIRWWERHREKSSPLFIRPRPRS
jgi:hypothetical protein